MYVFFMNRPVYHTWQFNKKHYTGTLNEPQQSTKRCIIMERTHFILHFGSSLCSSVFNPRPHHLYEFWTTLPVGWRKTETLTESETEKDGSRTPTSLTGLSRLLTATPQISSSTNQPTDTHARTRVHTGKICIWKLKKKSYVNHTISSIIVIFVPNIFLSWKKHIARW